MLQHMQKQYLRDATHIAAREKQDYIFHRANLFDRSELYENKVKVVKIFEKIARVVLKYR